MTGRVRTAGFLAGITLAWAIAFAATASPGDPIIGVDSYFGDDLEADYRGFTDHLAARLRVASVTMEAGSKRSIREGLIHGRYAAAFLSPYNYVLTELADKDDEVELVGIIERNGTDGYAYSIFANGEASPSATDIVKDGRYSFLVTDRESTSRYLLPVAWLMEHAEREGHEFKLTGVNDHTDLTRSPLEIVDEDPSRITAMSPIREQRERTRMAASGSEPNLYRVSTSDRTIPFGAVVIRRQGRSVDADSPRGLDQQSDASRTGSPSLAPLVLSRGLSLLPSLAEAISLAVEEYRIAKLRQAISELLLVESDRFARFIDPAVMSGFQLPNDSRFDPIRRAHAVVNGNPIIRFGLSLRVDPTSEIEKLTAWQRIKQEVYRRHSVYLEFRVYLESESSQMVADLAAGRLDVAELPPIPAGQALLESSDVLVGASWPSSDTAPPYREYRTRYPAVVVARATEAAPKYLDDLADHGRRLRWVGELVPQELEEGQSPTSGSSLVSASGFAFPLLHLESRDGIRISRTPDHTVTSSEDVLRFVSNGEDGHIGFIAKFRLERLRARGFGPAMSVRALDHPIEIPSGAYLHRRDLPPDEVAKLRAALLSLMETGPLAGRLSPGFAQANSSDIERLKRVYQRMYPEDRASARLAQIAPIPALGSVTILAVVLWLHAKRQRRQQVASFDSTTYWRELPQEQIPETVDVRSEWISSVRKKRVLVAGCGSGRTMRIVDICGAAEIVGIDINQSQVREARAAFDGHPSISVVEGDAATWIPADGRRFDVLLCSAFLTTVVPGAKRIEVLENLNRSLKANATIIIIDFLRNADHKDYVERYRRAMEEYELEEGDLVAFDQYDKSLEFIAHHFTVAELDELVSSIDMSRSTKRTQQGIKIGTRTGSVLHGIVHVSKRR